MRHTTTTTTSTHSSSDFSHFVAAAASIQSADKCRLKWQSRSHCFHWINDNQSDSDSIKKSLMKIHVWNKNMWSYDVEDILYMLLCSCKLTFHVMRAFAWLDESSRTNLKEKKEWNNLNHLVTVGKNQRRREAWREEKRQKVRRGKTNRNLQASDGKKKKKS